MPIAGEAVVIAYETQSEYDALTNKNPNAIYFITDTMRIYVGTSEYYSTMNDDTKEYVDYLIGRTPGTYYGTCDSNQANKQIKDISIIPFPDFIPFGSEEPELKVGTMFTIKFEAANTYSSTASKPVKFQFNGGLTGSYPIYYRDTLSPTGTQTDAYGSNFITTYLFDGEKLIWLGQNADRMVEQRQPPASGTFDLLMTKTPNNHSSETNISYKSGSSLNYNIATKELNINGNKALTTADIVVCTQSEYDNMQTRTGVLYLITGEVL